MTRNKCELCNYWESRWDYLEYSDDDLEEGDTLTKFKLLEIGACRRFPPVAVKHDDFVSGFDSFDGDATDFFEFPVTRSGDWCGEFKARQTVGASIAAPMGNNGI